ncbi:DUF4352 domain-containing protein [Nocardioides dubius]|uniref:DUF4352 domain-containing protein n=1 Tax=Nocardioides dubius TaxID=317019 RepID=A0ABN1TLV6_9ACTN
MDNPNPGQPTWQQPNLDPRAAAKAAKAYAKAQRPWFKKKRFMIPLALVVLIGIGSAAGGSDDKDGGPKVINEATEGSSTSKRAGAENADTAKSEPKEKPKEKAAPGTKENPVRIGKTVELEGTRYTVTAAKKAARVGDQYFGEDADGVFIIVDLTIMNTKNETKTFMDAAAKFVAKDDTSYETDSDASIMMADTSLMLTEMHPDLPTKGQLVFDVPPGKVKGAVLEVSDLFGGGEAYIALGLA